MTYVLTYTEQGSYGGVFEWRTEAKTAKAAEAALLREARKSGFGRITVHSVRSECLKGLSSVLRPKY